MAEHPDLHILQHSLGLDEYGRGNAYRNYFVTNPRGADGELCKALCNKGLMVDCGTKVFLNGAHVFRVTPAGECHVRKNSPKAPKRTRSQRRYDYWLRSGLGDVMSFGDYLKGRHYIG